jgi:hypothetical protein
MLCANATDAKKRYQRAVYRWMATYTMVVFISAWFVKHDGGEKFYLYFWSVFPALPVLAIVFRMGRYLREEKDEYQRWMVMQSILVGTAGLLAAVVVNDFLRGFAHVAGLPPFAEFLIFAAGMGLTQLVQKLRNRASDE